jgi:hypothetical protein
MLIPFAALLLQGLAASAAPRPEAKVVRVWLDADLVTRGASVRVYVQAAEDGNLVVLRRRTDGRMQVLFPTDPAADPGVRAGTYEIRGPDDRPGWVVEEPEGTGMVLAALSPDPLRFDEFVREAGWDPSTMVPTWSGSDGEGAMSDVVQRMLGDGYFHYDLVTYTVAPPVYAQQYLPPQDTASTYASYPPSAPCFDCTVIGVQVILTEPFGFCDGFFPGCLGARPFSRRREPCASLSPCGAPTPSALALSLGPPTAPEVAVVSPGRRFAIPRGGSGPSPIGPRTRPPARPVRNRAPAPAGVVALVSSAPRSTAPESERGPRAGARVEPRAGGARPATHGPLSHVRFTHLSAPTPESPGVLVAVRDGARAEGGTGMVPGMRAMPGTLDPVLPRWGGAGSARQGEAGHAPPVRQAARDPLGAGRAMAPAGIQPSLPAHTGPTVVSASGAGVTGGVASSPAVGSGAVGARAGSARGGVPARRR